MTRKNFGVSILKLKSKIQFNQSDTIISNATPHVRDLQCVEYVCIINTASITTPNRSQTKFYLPNLFSSVT